MFCSAISNKHLRDDIAKATALVLEMFGKVKNYKVCVLSKRHLLKHAYFSELKSHCKSIFDDIKRAVENGGYVIALKHKKLYKSVYIFEHDFSLEGNAMDCLSFTRSCTLPEVDKNTVNRFERIIIRRLRTMVFIGGYKQIVWRNTKFTPPHKNWGSRLQA